MTQKRYTSIELACSFLLLLPVPFDVRNGIVCQCASGVRQLATILAQLHPTSALPDAAMTYNVQMASTATLDFTSMSRSRNDGVQSNPYRVATTKCGAGGKAPSNRSRWVLD